MTEFVKTSVFESFRPYDQLLYECTSVLNDLSSSVWLNDVPSYSSGPEKTVVRFRARQSTQDVPLAVLSAFKHHLQNIAKMGKCITVLRKSQDWIEDNEEVLDRTPNIFHWKGGLVALANAIRIQHETVQSAIKCMERLGAVTYRILPTDRTSIKPCLFKVKAIVELNRPELGCTVKCGRIYTVVDQKNPFVWKLSETDQEVPSIFLEPLFSGQEERLCESVQNGLDVFKETCMTKICHILLLKLADEQTISESRRQLHFPRNHNARLLKAEPSVPFPQTLKKDITLWIEQFGKVQMSWKPVDQFWQWYNSIETRRSDVVESLQLGLRFIEALFQMENGSPTECIDESGFNETEFSPMSQTSNSELSSSFRWNAKLESITNIKREYSWKGNLNRTNEPMCPKDPRIMELPAASATAKAFTSNLIN